MTSAILSLAKKCRDVSIFFLTQEMFQEIKEISINNFSKIGSAVFSRVFVTSTTVTPLEKMSQAKCFRF